jgi:hypothetical protein
MSSRRWMAAIVTSLALAGCESPAAPERPEETLYAFDVSVTDDSLTRSLTGLTQVVTLPNGHAEPWPIPDGRMVGTDRTAFQLIPGPRAPALSIVLLGPFGTGEFNLRPRNQRLDPTARTFEAGYSIEIAPGQWRHYKIDGGTVTVGMDGDRRMLTFALTAETAELVSSSARSRRAPIPIALSGTLIEVPGH